MQRIVGVSATYKKRKITFKLEVHVMQIRMNSRHKNKNTRQAICIQCPQPVLYVKLYCSCKNWSNFEIYAFVCHVIVF